MQLSFDDVTPRAEPSEPKIYVVNEIVHLASQELKASFTGIWIEGEVSNLRIQQSGHFYFSLKDSLAQIAVVMFRSSANRLKFHIENGQKLRCYGSLGVYEVRGQFQLTAEAAEPAGLGALQMALEQLKRKLKAEGLFAEEHKKSLPLLPRTIAVVTSPTGAAIKDILRVLAHRCPTRVIICPTFVQGEEAPRAITAALAKADNLGADLIIAGRGGGSLEDLWAFNTEMVARAIFAQKTPIISAVGHEIDWTLADLVADWRAPTPSAAAEKAVPVRDDLLEMLSIFQKRLNHAMVHRINGMQQVLERLRFRFPNLKQSINQHRQFLDDHTRQLEDHIHKRVQEQKNQLNELESLLARSEPRVRLRQKQHDLGNLRHHLIALTQQKLIQRKNVLQQKKIQITALSPLAVLERGYTLTLDDQRRLIRNPKQLSIGQPITLLFSHGEALCRVEGIHSSHSNEKDPR